MSDSDRLPLAAAVAARGARTRVIVRDRHVGGSPTRRLDEAIADGACPLVEPRTHLVVADIDTPAQLDVVRRIEAERTALALLDGEHYRDALLLPSGRPDHWHAWWSTRDALDARTLVAALREAGIGVPVRVRPPGSPHHQLGPIPDPLAGHTPAEVLARLRRPHDWARAGSSTGAEPTGSHAARRRAPAPTRTSEPSASLPAGAWTPTGTPAEVLGRLQPWARQWLSEGLPGREDRSTETMSLLRAVCRAGGSAGDAWALLHASPAGERLRDRIAERGEDRARRELARQWSRLRPGSSTTQEASPEVLAAWEAAWTAAHELAPGPRATLAAVLATMSRLGTTSVDLSHREIQILTGDRDRRQITADRRALHAAGILTWARAESPTGAAGWALPAGVGPISCAGVETQPPIASWRPAVAVLRSEPAHGGQLGPADALLLAALRADVASPTAPLAAEIGISARQTRERLAALAALGLVDRVGERGGWLLSEAARQILAGPGGPSDGAAQATADRIRAERQAWRERQAEGGARRADLDERAREETASRTGRPVQPPRWGADAVWRACREWDTWRIPELAEAERARQQVLRERRDRGELVRRS